MTANQILEELADESVVDLRSYWPLQPLIHIDLYHIPHQPKKVQDWIIMQGKLLLIENESPVTCHDELVDHNPILVNYTYPSDPMIATRFYEDQSILQKIHTEPSKDKVCCRVCFK
jgi:hypothetical protein